MRRKFSPITLACLPILACGGGGGGRIDSGIRLQDGSGSGSGSATCTAAASYAAPTFTGGSNGNSSATNYPVGTYPGLGSQAPHVEVFDGALNSDPDLLELQFWAGYGGFGSGDVKTGTFPLTGSDADPEACGICSFIYTNLHMVGSGIMVTDDYFANGGSVTITSVGTNGSGTLSGTVSNLTFEHVMFGSDNVTVVGDCTSTIASASFSGVLAAGSAGFSGKGEDQAPYLFHHRHY